MTANAPTLAQAIEADVRQIEKTLEDALSPVEGGDGQVTEAMRYAVLGGGKRLRGFLVLETSRLLNVSLQDALSAAASVECLHAYSLVHDDLPCMDDDDFRRGRPSTHKRFGEARAVLAGDALQAAAFEMILALKNPHRADLALALAEASGRAGMVGGQALDIAGEGQSLTLKQIRHIHASKTGALIRYSAEVGPILDGRGENDPLRRALAQYGALLGTAFQVTDDILDHTQSSESLGKTAGKDEASGKSTYVSLLGLEGARKEALRLVTEARESLAPFRDRAAILIQLADYVVTRRK